MAAPTASRILHAEESGRGARARPLIRPRRRRQVDHRDRAANLVRVRMDKLGRSAAA
jgi:hypothetical protein